MKQVILSLVALVFAGDASAQVIGMPPPSKAAARKFGWAGAEKASEARLALGADFPREYEPTVREEEFSGRVVKLWEFTRDRNLGKHWPTGKQEIGDCFMQGTIVLGERIKPIEEVQVGDRVWTAEGKLTRVVSTRKTQANKPIVTVHSLGGLPIKCTADHRFLVYRMQRISGKRVTASYYERALIPGQPFASAQVRACYESRTPEWVPAGELTDTDYLLMPTRVETPFETPDAPGGLAATSDGRYLLGYFLGDGHASGGSVEIALSNREISDHLAATLTAAGFNPRVESYGKDCNAWRIRVHSRELVGWMREQFYDADSAKSFPAWAIGDRQFLEGLQAADGSKDGRTNRLDSTSRSVVYGAYTTLIDMGYEPTVAEIVRSQGSYPNAKPIYRLIWRDEKQRALLWRDERFVCRPVTKVVPVEGPQEVYDIGVEDEHHSFIADGAAVHNCVSWGWSHGILYTLAVQLVLTGGDAALERPFQPYIYGVSRVQVGGGRISGDGSLGTLAAAAVKKHGVVTEKAPGCPPYSGQVARQWGRSGPPKEFLALGEKSLADVRLIRTWEEACSAIATGHAIPVCSDVGFEKIVERNGRVEGVRQGSWPHCMCFIGFDARPGLEALYCLNSWGPDAHAPAESYGRLDRAPPGGFWILRRDVEQMLREEDSFAVSFTGFKAAPLWSRPALGPREDLEDAPLDVARGGGPRRRDIDVLLGPRLGL